MEEEKKKRKTREITAHMRLCVVFFSSLDALKKMLRITSGRCNIFFRAAESTSVELRTFARSVARCARLHQ